MGPPEGCAAHDVPEILLTHAANSDGVSADFGCDGDGIIFFCNKFVHGPGAMRLSRVAVIALNQALETLETFSCTVINFI